MTAANFNEPSLGREKTILDLKNMQMNESAAGKGSAQPEKNSKIEHKDSDSTSPSSASDKKKEFEGDIDIDDDVALTFPQRLMEILDNVDHTDIISWLPHGRGFVIFRKKAFEQHILPKYFNKQSKYSSFTRKLNRWGFQRVTRGPETGAYFHQFFQRGGHRLCMQMSCQSTNKSATAIQDAVSSLAANNGVGLLCSLPGMSLHSADRIALQQQNQLAQSLLKQQIMQQEMVCRAMLNQRAQTDQSNLLLQMLGGNGSKTSSPLLAGQSGMLGASNFLGSSLLDQNTLTALNFAAGSY